MSTHSPVATNTQMPRGLLISLVVSWSVLYVLGVWGHLDMHNGWVESMYKSLQLFHLHYHPDAGDAHGAVPWSLQFARFGAGLWALSLYPALVALLFQRSLAHWWVKRHWHGHTVVWGHCHRTLNLVLDLAREGQRVVFIGQSRLPPAELPRGVVFLEGSEDRIGLLEQAALARASRLVALNETDTANLEVLVAAEKVCATRSASLAPLDCSAHFADTHLQGGLYRMVVSAPAQQQSHIRQHLFNYYDIVAGALARRFPLPEADVHATPLPEHYVIVGFGAFGQCVARKLVKTGLQLYKEEGDAYRVRKTRITVVDPRGEKAVQAFLHSNPQFTDYCELQILPMACDDPSFVDLSFLKGSPPARRTSVLLCLWNEDLTIRTALLLRDSCARGSGAVDLIGLRVARPERLGSLLDSLQSDSPHGRFLMFAPDREVFTADALLHLSLDALAREVHEAYLKVEAADRRANNQPPAAGKTWEELSEDDRQGNREAADHVWARLAALGYELQPVGSGEATPKSDPALLEDLCRTEEDMARLEHERWMAWRLLNGWRWGSPRDNAAKLHPDIVDYDKLAESTKEKDRIIIRAIPDLLRQGRLRVVKGQQRQLGGSGDSQA